jgi:predicted MPP superfamily phosphohydrolase
LFSCSVVYNRPMRVTRRVVLRSLTGAGFVVAGIGAYGFGIGRRRVEVTHTAIPLPTLPLSLAGLRVGLISDIHCGEFMPVEYIAEAAGLLMRERPDIILVAGDHVTWKDQDSLPACAEGLSPLTAPLGVFAVEGNHDPDVGLAKALGARGRIHVLEDEHVLIRARGETIALGGLRYWSQRASDVRRVFQAAPGFQVLLAHDPRRLVQAAQLGVPLVFSGHTHGGQVNVPLVGSPAAWRFPVVAGLGKRNRSMVYVTRGLGTVVIPVRFNCPPEISILTLERGWRSTAGLRLSTFESLAPRST